jgi:nucleoside-diphosphate-sugar epimerase
MPGGETPVRDGGGAVRDDGAGSQEREAAPRSGETPVRALVTGAGGFVGANLVRRLCADGHEVHAVCRPSGSRGRLWNLDGIAVHEANLAAPGTAGALVNDVAPDWIFHLAAHGAYSWENDAQRICEANLYATIELADAAERLGVRAFVHAGSSSEYGFKDHPAEEEERPDPNSTYAVAKAAATMYCGHRAREGELPAVTLRLYSVYGALEDPRRLVAKLLTEGLQGCLPPLVSPGTARDFVYVEDVCDAFLLAASGADGAAGGIYNVGSGRETSIGELVEHVRALLDIPATPRWGTHAPRKWDSDIWCASTAKTARDLGWSATTGVEDGLRRTIGLMGGEEAHGRARVAARGG